MENWNIWESDHLYETFGYTGFAIDKLPIADDGTEEYTEYKQEKRRHSASYESNMQYTIGKILDQDGFAPEKAIKFVTFADDISISLDLAPEVDAKNCPLRQILKKEGEALSIYPVKIKRKPGSEPMERFICVLAGEESLKMLSPVFKQNIYQGVYDYIHPEDIPSDIDMFNIDTTQFPLLALVSDYILNAKLEKGDCVYVPALYWIQSESQEEKTMLHTQRFGATSRMADLMFEALDHADVLEKKEEF